MDIGIENDLPLNEKVKIIAFEENIDVSLLRKAVV